MTSSKDYVEYIMEQLAEAGDVRNRAMMGEYVVYYRDKVLGGIYDDRFLVKPVAAAKELMPEAEFVIPYQGSKEMLLVDNIEDKAFLAQLCREMYDQLPAPKPKKKKSK